MEGAVSVLTVAKDFLLLYFAQTMVELIRIPVYLCVLLGKTTG